MCLLMHSHVVMVSFYTHTIMGTGEPRSNGTPWVNWMPGFRHARHPERREGKSSEMWKIR